MYFPGAGERSSHTFSTVLDGIIYRGSGPSKKVAKDEVARQTLTALRIKYDLPTSHQTNHPPLQIASVSPVASSVVSPGIFLLCNQLSYSNT